MNDEIIKMLIFLAKKAEKKNEIPVGCIIRYRGAIISKAYNRKENNNDVLGHAEIIAIKKAAKKLDSWKLDECEMYVTLKPCSMCNEIIKQSRIKKVYYLTDRLDFKKEYNKTEFIKLDDNEEYIKILSKFFENMRKK